MAVNYGGIGMVMGHEITHGFDDQGSQYDGYGNLRSWWPKPVVDAFKERAQCFVKQYSNFTVGRFHVNGNLTLGENIADNGGIRLAIDAYRLYTSQNGNEPALLQELSNEQLLFLSFAQGWCQLTTPEFAEELVQRDEHSPAFARVLGPLRNLDDFAKAYNCPLGSNMNPANKCLLW